MAKARKTPRGPRRNAIQYRDSRGRRVNARNVRGKIRGGGGGASH